jgi:hypothetical protein
MCDFGGACRWTGCELTFEIVPGSSAHTTGAVVGADSSSSLPVEFELTFTEWVDLHAPSPAHEQVSMYRGTNRADRSMRLWPDCWSSTA